MSDFDSKMFEEQCRTELELERSRCLHTHQLIFKVMTAYVTITLAAFGAAGFFLRERLKPPIPVGPFGRNFWFDRCAAFVYYGLSKYNQITLGVYI